MSAERKRKKLVLSKGESHSIRFSKEEWEALFTCGETDFGGARQAKVVRIFCRGQLKKRGYL